MAKYDVSVKISGFMFRTVEADTRQEAEAVAMTLAYADDWNEMECAETKVIESEEYEA